MSRREHLVRPIAVWPRVRVNFHPAVDQVDDPVDRHAARGIDVRRRPIFVQAGIGHLDYQGRVGRFGVPHEVIPPGAPHDRDVGFRHAGLCGDPQRLVAPRMPRAGQDRQQRFDGRAERFGRRRYATVIRASGSPGSRGGVTTGPISGQFMHPTTPWWPSPRWPTTRPWNGRSGSAAGGWGPRCPCRGRRRRPTRSSRPTRSGPSRSTHRRRSSTSTTRMPTPPSSTRPSRS